MREKLIEILRKPIFPHELVDPTEAVADYLLDNGVIVLPCKVGDTVYYHTSIGGIVAFTIVLIRIRMDCIELVNTTGVTIFPEDIGKTVFLTREEAEAALKEVQG